MGGLKKECILLEKVIFVEKKMHHACAVTA